MELHPIITDPFHERRLDRTQERAPTSPENNLKMYMLLSDLMLWLSFTEGSSKKRRSARRAFLVSRWMQLSGDSLKGSFPGTFLL